MEEECIESLLDRPAVRVPLIVAYIGVFLICLIGNLFTIVVICAHRSMRTATNFFLANLAVADLLVAIFCILQNMLHLFGAVHGHWPLGETLCKLYAFVLHLVPCTGIGILVCVSMEKYIAVLHPLLALKLLTPRFRFLMMAAIWSISLLANLPFFTTTRYNVYTSLAVCSRGAQLDRLISSRNMLTLSFIIWYCIPLCTIAFLYTRIGLVLWRSVPLKKLTQPALRTNSNETTTLVSAAPTGQAGQQQQQQKRSVTSYRMSASAAANGTASMAESMGLRSSKRSHSQPTPNGTPVNLLPLIRVNRTETLVSSESGGEGSLLGEEEEGEDESEEEMQQQLDVLEARGRLALGNGIVGPASQGTTGEQTGVGQKNSLPSSAAAIVVSTVESRKKIIRLLIAIVCSFAVLTLPHHARLLHSVWSNEVLSLCGPEALVQPVTYLLLFLSSSCNPFLYAFMSQRFRSAIRDIFKCRRGRMRRKSTRTRTQNSELVACGVSSCGEALSRCSSLTRLNHPATQCQPSGQNGLATAGSERNLHLVNQQQQKANGNHLLKVNSPLFGAGKGERSASGGSGGSTASSVVYTQSQRSNGSLQMAVVYRKNA